jgi:multicomponent Na+:H+ antiporter subunit F
MIDTAYNILFFGAVIVIAVLIIISLIRTITGKLTADKIIGLNMTSTLTVLAMIILTALLGEDYIADIAIIYVMLSFISILILAKIYINLYNLRDGKEDEKND